MAVRLLGVLVGVLLALGIHAEVFADHTPDGRLPYVPNTPAIQQMLTKGYISWCVDSRASTYPGFVSQLRAVTAAAAARTTVVPVEITLGPSTDDNVLDVAKAAGCQVVHTMPSVFNCNGCAAFVNYANWPVSVIYNWRLGYTNWYTTQAHEGTNCGHVAGEHEGYVDDPNDPNYFKSFILTYGYWASPWNAPSVMDVGSHLLSLYAPLGVWECTEADLAVMSKWLLPQWFPGGRLVQYGDHNDVYFGPADLAVTKRLAVYIRTYTGYTFWSGQWATPVASGIGGVTLNFPLGPCTEILLGAENALPLSWGRGLQSVGITSCF